MIDPVMMEASGRPRLILLTQWFDPEPTMKGLRFAEMMDELGFDVEVVTGFPNYPGGAVYEGYRIRPIQRERVKNINITRLALFPSHDRSKLGRVLNYFSFSMSATLYLIFFARKADVLYAHHPPLTTGVTAIITRYLRRLPFVLDIQDMWPDTLRATGMVNSDVLISTVGRVCRWTYRHADHITVLSEGFRRLLIQRGVPEHKVTVIYNWADETPANESGVVEPISLGKPDSFKVLYAGNMGLAQGLGSVLDAANILRLERPNIEMYFLGGGLELEPLRERVSQEGLENVHFLPRVPLAEVGAYLAGADCLLVHLRADSLFEITIPSKTQAYLRSAKPLIMAVAGDAAEIVRQSGGGVTVTPGDARELAGAMMQLADLPKEDLARMGSNGHAFYLKEMSFAKGTRAFSALLHSLAKGRGKDASC